MLLLRCRHAHVYTHHPAAHGPDALAHVHSAVAGRSSNAEQVSQHQGGVALGRVLGEVLAIRTATWPPIGASEHRSTGSFIASFLTSAAVLKDHNVYFTD
jgi:hypothetical protein